MSTHYEKYQKANKDSKLILKSKKNVYPNLINSLTRKILAGGVWYSTLFSCKEMKNIFPLLNDGTNSVIQLWLGLWTRSLTMRVLCVMCIESFVCTLYWKHCMCVYVYCKYSVFCVNVANTVCFIVSNVWIALFVFCISCMSLFF